MGKAVVFEYEIDYEKARREAENLAKGIIQKHPNLRYKIIAWQEEGVYIELYGDDEELVWEISQSLAPKKLKLLLAGAPVYIVYGGKTKAAA
jgi:hypothetical protein